MESFIHLVQLALSLTICLTPSVSGHGRLLDPPSRSSMWRAGFPTPTNYQDNELNCGGLGHQINMGYKCGICGDPFDGERKNEEGGVYATGLISRTYHQGQIVTIDVDLTSNHKGYFEFKICPKSSKSERTTQECLDRYPLILADRSGTHFSLTSSESRLYKVDVVLPSGLICDYCVLQWRYHAGNSWGQDPDGTQCIGCGNQEEFYGCADIRIVPPGTIIDSNTIYSPTDKVVHPSHQDNASPPVSNNWPTSGSNTQPPARGTASSSSPAGAAMYGKDCLGVAGRTELNSWCKVNCQLGFCPPTHCTCPGSPVAVKNCKAVGLFATVSGAHRWCEVNCAGGFCPDTHCACS